LILSEALRCRTLETYRYRVSDSHRRRERNNRMKECPRIKRRTKGGLFIYPSIYPSIIPICLSAYLSICPSIYLHSTALLYSSSSAAILAFLPPFLSLVDASVWIFCFCGNKKPNLVSSLLTSFSCFSTFLTAVTLSLLNVSLFL